MSKRRRPSAPAPTLPESLVAATVSDGSAPPTESTSALGEWGEVSSAVLPLVLVAIPVVMLAVMLLPELTIPLPASNDLALHWQMVQAASDALSHGRNPFDFWMPQIELGYPQFLYYQNLPHLLVAVAHKVLLGLVPLRTLFDLSRYLLLVCLPITMYWSMRRLQFSMQQAAVGAAVVSLIAARDGFGLEYDGHIWIGRGLYTQLWAEHFLLITLATLYRLFKSGQGYLPAVLAVTALALTHFIWSYIAAIASLLLWALVSDKSQRVSNLARLGIVGVLAACIASYMLVPFAVSGSKFVAVSGGGRREGYNPLTPFITTISGELMDERRWPILTVMTLVGVVAAVVSASPSARVALIGTAVWLVLYSVRPARVGWLGHTLRYDGNLIFRMVGVLEIFACMLIGVGGAWLWSLVARAYGRLRKTDAALTRSTQMVGQFAGLALVLAVLAPALKERYDLLALNGRSLKRTQVAIANDPDLTAMLDSVTAQPTGRAYMGTERNWGKALRVGPLLRAYDLLKARGHPAVTSPYQALSLNTDITVAFNDGSPALYDLLDVRYIIVPSASTPPPFVTRMLTTPRYTVYRAPTTGVAVYAGMVERRRVQSQIDLVEQYDTWARTNGPETRRFIRWDYFSAAKQSQPTQPCPNGGRTLSESMAANTIDLVVACPAPSSLVIKATYHPNWHVSVDGTPVEVYMASPSFLAIDLPAGQHTVSARYEMAGSKLALLAFGIVTLLVTIALRDRLDLLPQRLRAAGIGH